VENVIALVAATVVLILIPGPNVALIVANSLRHGMRIGIITSFGTTVGVGLQLLVVVLGMAALIELVADALTWIKWIGVVYLLYIGVRIWHEPAADLADIKAQSQARAFWHGVILAVINPKTLLFNAAFLPQFVGNMANASGQLLLLAGVFMTVIIIGDALWAVFAAAARAWLNRIGHLHNRISGAFLFSAGVGLALSRRTLQ
jgi:threonine/homoserine/homoserine lactone efflux protein